MKRVFAHIGFSFAITLIVLNFLKIEAAFVILAITGVAFAVSVFIRKTRNSLSVPLCMFMAVLACAVFISNYFCFFLPQKELDAKTVNVDFYIVDLEEKKNDAFVYTVKTSFIDKENMPQNIKLTVKSESKIEAAYYQNINGTVKLRLIAENGFDSYGSFGNGIFLSGKLLDYSVTDENVFSINKFFLNQRENIKSFVSSNIKSPESSVITALLIGDKSDLPNQINENFKYSGVSHIMAVSGLHLAIFCGAVSFLLRKLKIPRTAQMLITLLCVVIYMSLAGFSKSIFRAGIMMIMLLCGRLLNERSDSLNSLGMAVFIICLNPFAVTDAGALLTATSVLGILVINPLLVQLYRPKTWLAGYVYKTVCVSLSVFITTLPVICITFGYISLFGILLNIVMIPLAQAALISSFLMILFGKIHPLLFIFSRLCRLFASIMILITEKTAAIPYAVADVSENKIFLAIGAVFIFFGMAFLFYRKRLLKHTVLIAAAIFTIVIMLSDFIGYNNIYVKEINGYYTSSVVVYNKKNAVVIGVDDSLQYYSVSNMIKSKNLSVSMIVDINNSDYSKKLANKFGALNYVCDNENIKYLNNCSNFFSDDDFIVDLWPQLNVEYKSNAQNQYVHLQIYDTEFLCVKKYEDRNLYDNIICLNDKSDYDVVYTVNQNGFNQRRLNEWQR